MDTTLHASGAKGAAGDAAGIALWNPVAAVLWSLLLTPALGAWIHMRNWERLGEPQKAAQARDWCIAVILINLVNLAVVTAAAAAGHDISIPPSVNLAFFAVWYILSAHPQVKHVAQHHGAGYARRPWLLPLALAAAAIMAFLGLTAVLGAAFTA